MLGKGDINKYESFLLVVVLQYFFILALIKIIDNLES